MNATTEQADFLRDLFPEGSAELLRLFAAAADNANLTHTDFYTIRDLLDLSDYAGPETLHVLILDLLLALEEGSLCVEASPIGLARRLTDLAGDSEAQAWAQRILADLNDPGFPHLIGTGPTDQKPIVFHSAANRHFLYFQKHLHHEFIFRQALANRLQADQPTVDLACLKEIVHEVLNELPLRMDGQPLRLDSTQRLALGLSLVRNFGIVSGGPGTGKTSIVLTLLRCLVRAGFAPDRIALAAPTGRAAQRLSDAVRTGLSSLQDPGESSADDRLHDLAAHTLHHLLRYNPARGTFGRHRENPIPADVIVVDEVSMVGLVLMSQLLQAIAPTTRLILLGDKDQLPSVDAGAVLGNLVPQTGRPAYSPTLRAQLGRLFEDLDIPPGDGPLPDVLVVLQENYRSQPHIRDMARAINLQDIEVVERLPVVSLNGAEGNGRPASLAELEKQGGCWFLPQTAASVSELRGILEQWAQHQYLDPAPGLGNYPELVACCSGVPITEAMPAEAKQNLDRLFQMLARSRLLTLVRESPWGCVDINHFMDQFLRPRWDRTSRSELFAGAPVLITRNDYVRQLFNGDVGLTLRNPGGGLGVIFPRQVGYVAYSADALPAHELGFALTVHKSQGSEYGQVLLILPPAGGRRLLTKEIIYTGITRAKQLAILCGTKEVLRFAIGRKIERESGLLPMVSGELT